MTQTLRLIIELQKIAQSNRKRNSINFENQLEEEMGQSQYGIKIRQNLNRMFKRIKNSSTLQRQKCNAEINTMIGIHLILTDRVESNKGQLHL
ncbi:unnamed protein product [Paramecium octaurelia]|uniref:Uncharacterized protein n=1 Tax=Paramecium octaurelia TaxID=43137 RepID=A0A8S1WAH3_PAROT|nr:unnamed protein product [Paramecium octaurelia]